MRDGMGFQCEGALLVVCYFDHFSFQCQLILFHFIAVMANVKLIHICMNAVTCNEIDRIIFETRTNFAEI